MQTTREKILEIRLERLDERTWVAALTKSAGAAFGTAAFRFAGRVQESGDDSEDLFSATFPLMRSQNLDESGVGDAWSDVARMRLHELDHALQQAGWTPVASRGRHWWSLRYARE